MHVFSCLPGDGPVTGGLISVGRGAYKQQFIVRSQAGSNHAISREVVCIHFSKQQTELFKCLSSLMDSYSTWALHDPIVAPHDPRRVSKINTD